VGIGTDLLSIASVGLSVGQPREYTVAKRLIGSDAVWGGKWGRSRDGCIRWWWRIDWRSSKGGADLAVNVGHPIVASWDFVT